MLAVAPYVPFEGIEHAGGSYLLRHLEQMHRSGHRVSLIVPGIPEQLVNVPRAPQWLDLVMGPHVTQGRSMSRVLRDAAYRRAMNSPPAPTAESLRSVLAAGLVARATGADVVELHWAEYARFASVLRRARVRTPVAVVEHDVDLDAAVKRVRATARGYRRSLALLTAPWVRRTERRGLLDADVVFVFKAADEAVLRLAGVPTDVHVIDPWLETPSQLPGRRSGRVLFAGALWRKENEDGLVWLLEQVWPLVAEQVPSAQLDLVGAGPTDRLRAAASRTSGVRVVGQVPDLIPYYVESSLFVAPLFVSGGLKFKVPQAMVCGLPVVATPVAVEGVTEVAPAGTLWAVTDAPAEMAAAVVAALRDPEAAASVGRAAASWSTSFYSFAHSVARVLAIYSALSARGDVAGRPDHEPQEPGANGGGVPLGGL